MTLLGNRTLRLAALCVWLAGCAGSDTTRFYTLSAETSTLPATSPMAESSPPPSVGLTPVVVPKYLDRPQLVTRPDANAVELNEFDKWSEPLADQFRRTLAADISRLLASERIHLMPVRRAVPIERLVDVQIGRFEAGADGAITLEAQWQIYADDGARLIAQRSSSIRESIGDASGAANPASEAAKPEAIVAAMSRATARLAQDIAAALRAEPRA